ncbi:hypothetical protein DMN91_012823 [Ooceraea biroi]|uniref:Uncharacterized protein n=1 Tax=Ooceraea biroi TaxID=2015173 RepID=A0A026VXI7_OOCBI|nr:uncharacterized protein LOC105285492 [Ooceraea biroi]EZA48487.1 hypothetical protein X777_12981 [Ooceraea biroi]RLU14936.1 hypothetical protein DMN91_012823 [Ooceraea biroi]
MIMLALHGFLIITTCHIIAVTPAPTKVYDQRQTGDLNVQIELKDLRVVALINSELLDDYTDYDYFYDYADFTVKPGSRPTTSPTTKITEKNDIAETTEPVSLQNSTISNPPPNNINSTEQNTTLSNNEEMPSVDQSNGTTISISNADDKSQESQESQESQSSEEDSGTEAVTSSITMKPLRILRSQKRCKSGYIPNGDGRCRRASRPWLSLLQRQ